MKNKVGEDTTIVESKKRGRRTRRKGCGKKNTQNFLFIPQRQRQGSCVRQTDERAKTPLLSIDRNEGGRSLLDFGEKFKKKTNFFSKHNSLKKTEEKNYCKIV